ncbi:MAG: hybrid sensor histidine kinase/response regulator, partial [Bdellovibrionia bacterium]
ALNQVKAGRISLIVSDIMMPEMDGLELVSRLKKDRDFQHIPIILLTAKVSQEELVMGLTVGADDYLPKPFGPAELRARIRAALRLREIQEQLIQASKMAAMGSLIAGLSHELNNPLAAISMNAELLLRARKIDDPKLIKSVETIRIQTERCARLVRALLDFSLQKPVKMELIVPSVLLERVMELVSPLARRKDIEIKMEMSAQKLEGIILRVCIQEIETALINLVSNALGVTSAGGSILIKAEAKKREEREGLEISVIDTGQGISADVLPYIFDPFFTTKPPGEGIGLGLSLTRKTVESHGGFISVESEEGIGTSFRLWLPAEARRNS